MVGKVLELIVFYFYYNAYSWIWGYTSMDFLGKNLYYFYGFNELWSICLCSK